MRKRKLTTHNGWPLHNMSTLGGEGTMNGYCFLFTMSHAPTTDSHVQWLVQTTMDPRAPRGWDGMGWDGMVVGAYIGLLHL